jgi:hypothetical protein
LNTGVCHSGGTPSAAIFAGAASGSAIVIPRNAMAIDWRRRSAESTWRLANINWQD